MIKYEFDPADAERFAREIGSKARRKNRELEFAYCPYCHGGGGKDAKTFSISLETGQFECKRSSCGVHGNMITLARDFDFSINRDVDAYYSTADYSKKQYKSFRDSHKHVEVRPRAIEYLTGRGISEEVVRKYEITTMKGDKENVLVFPFKSEDGELEFIKYRNMDFVKGSTGGSKEWCEPGCKPILFGMNHCEDHDTLVITEGQIDSLACATAGIKNAVSVPTGCNGFTWVPYCWDFVSSFEHIIVFGDCENGKITLSEDMVKRWGDRVKTVKAESYRGCKDANELLQKIGPAAIHEAIQNAEAAPDPRIKPLSTVRRVDILKIPAIKTGLEELDEVLDGGFHLGQLGVLTGKRGEGKSTIASNFGVRALDQNYNSFFYSGELVDFYFKNWMDCQVTGKDHLRQSEEDALAKWYGDKAYIHDNTYIGEDSELTSLPEEIERAIVRYGCRFILVDNLMTAIEDDLATDIYRMQSKFVGELASLAKKYEVFILIIAHPRKTSNEITNDDVAGSSNITDKADIVMSYGKSSQEGATENDRELKVLKNRLTGKIRTEKNPIRLVYDSTGSRRVAQKTSDFFKINFDWMDDTLYDMVDGFEIIDESDVEPF